MTLKLLQTKAVSKFLNHLSLKKLNIYILYSNQKSYIKYPEFGCVSKQNPDGYI